jgi:hypothetical protein
MTAAADWAEHHNLEIYRTTDYCYQIEGYNFWPDKGTIQTESSKKCSERGLAGLADILKKPLLEGGLSTAGSNEVEVGFAPSLLNVWPQR